MITDSSSPDPSVKRKDNFLESPDDILVVLPGDKLLVSYDNMFTKKRNIHAEK